MYSFYEFPCVFQYKVCLLINKVFGLRFRQQFNSWRQKKKRKRESEGRTNRPHVYAKTNIHATHTQGYIIHQKHQSGNHPHYTHHLAVSSAVLTSASLWSELRMWVCVCVFLPEYEGKHLQCMCKWMCFDLFAHTNTCVGVIPACGLSTNAWQRAHAQSMPWQVVFPCRKVKDFQTFLFFCMCVWKRQRVGEKKRDKKSDTWPDTLWISRKRGFTVLCFHKVENKYSLSSVHDCVCVIVRLKCVT